MCFSYSVHSSQQSLPFSSNNIIIPQPGFFFSGFQHPHLPICTASENWENAQWGLVPSWASDIHAQQEIMRKTLNARIESIEEKPSFKSAWEQRPCIVACSGFFEWKHVNKQKIPHYIYNPDHPWLFFGGIYEDFKDKSSNTWLRSYSIITTKANKLMSEIHNTKERMPLILPPELLSTWLHSNASARMKMKHSIPEEFLKAYPVSSALNSNRTDRNQSWALKEVKPPENWTLF